MICIRTDDRMVWRHWEGELIFYDTASGQTNIVTGLEGVVLELLTELGPTSRTKLDLAIETALGSSLDDDFRKRLHTTLENLYTHNFIDYSGDEALSAP